MSISDKTKAVDNNIEQNKAQCNLDRQTGKLVALSSENVSKYVFLTGKYVSPEKDLLEKVATMEGIEYFQSDSYLKAQTDIELTKLNKLTTEKLKQ